MRPDMARLRVLLTGFEPFGGASLNPSQELVRVLSADPPTVVDLRTAVLPVEFGAAADQLLALVHEVAPDVVIATGQAEGRREMSWERVAVNLDDARIPDNAGATRSDESIVHGGPSAYFTTLPVKEMVEAVRAAGVPAGLSLSAGTFVCNHVFYALAHHLRDTNVRSGFLHLPLIPEQSAEFPDQPVMPLTDMVTGMHAAFTAL